METILITGAAGFIGRNVLETPGSGEYELMLCDRRPIEDAFSHEVVINEVSEITVSDLEQVDHVIHLAAMTSVPESVENPHGCYIENVTTTMALLKKCRQAGNIKTFVFASSCGVNGGSGESHVPISPYTASKAMIEDWLHAYSHCYGLRTRVLRFTNVYGPYSEGKTSLVAKCMENILAGEPMIVYGDGDQTRDFVYSKDLAKAIIAQIDIEDNEPYRVQTIGSGETTSVMDVIGMISRLAHKDGMELMLKYGPERDGDIREFKVDPNMKSFCENTPIETAIAETWKYFKDKKGGD